MMYWNPTENDTKEWTPVGGWNSTFSEQDKIKCITLFFFFKLKKGYNEKTANSLAQMIIYKEKHTGLRYSDEQEQLIQDALIPVFHS